MKETFSKGKHHFEISFRAHGILTNENIEKIIIYIFKMINT